MTRQARGRARTGMLFAAAVGISSLGTQAQAENTVSAAALLEACTRAHESWISFCNGFFQAAHDLGTLNGDVCAPSDTTRTRLARIYQSDAQRLFSSESGLSSEAAISVATAIFANRFPCP
ncbi:MAG: Rap1a/Tai family immunity protein [Pseudomonadota bacterium]